METIKSLTGFTCKQILNMPEVTYRASFDKLEDENRHGSCAILKACRDGKENNAAALVHLQEIHNIIGHMTSAMLDLRSELSK